jgi:hypothetical protein
MGFSPAEVDRMSVWQFMAALDGYIEANSSDEDKSLSGQEADEIWEWLQSKVT